ncbi:unnamed protein product, partial [Cyprideis torosa]
AGWRGLADGVLESTLQALDCPAAEITVWLGPAIGPEAFEVGTEVKAAFTSKLAAAEQAFRPSPNADRWLADLYLLARQRLMQSGVRAISGGDFCTYKEKARFFSYRREGTTGRMASLIWLEQ